MNRTLQRGSTGRSIVLKIRGSATSPAGMALTGLAYNTAGLIIAYTRYDLEGQPTAAPTAITLATQTVTGAWASGGFVETSATNAKGEYRLDLPDAALAAGAHGVSISWQGANTVEDSCFIELTDYDPFAGSGTAVDVNVTQWLGTAVETPAVAGRPSVDVKAISGDTVAADNLEAAADGTGYNLGNGSVVAASVTGAVGSVTGAVGSVTGNVGGNVVGSVGSVTGAVGSVTGNVGGTVNGLTTTAQGNVRTAVGLASANLDTQLLTIAGYLDTEIAAILAAVDTEIAAIKAKTDQLAFTNAGKVDAAVLAAADFAQVAADKAWSTISRSLTDKDGFALSTAGVSAITTDIDANSGDLDALAATLVTIAGYVDTLEATLAAGVTLTVAERAAVADKILVRSVAGGSDAGVGTNARSVGNALRRLVNRVYRDANTGGNLIVTAEDDATAVLTQALTTASAALPITNADTGDPA